MVKSTVNTISNANTNTAGSSATKGATSPAVSCARNNSSNMVVLREWYNDNEKYCKDKYQGFNSSLTWDDKTNTATVFMSGNGSVNYVNIKPGKDGSYIKDGKLYVDQAVLMKNLGPAIDPAAKKIHDVDALIIGTAIGAKGISSGINIIKNISAADAAVGTAVVKGGDGIVELTKNNIQHISKHSFEGMKNQAQYLTDKQLADKLNKTTFFNKNWSQDKIVQYTEEAYNTLKNQGKTGLNSVKINGETINVFIKDDGAFDTAYGVYTFTVKDFR